MDFSVAMNLLQGTFLFSLDRLSTQVDCTENKILFKNLQRSNFINCNRVVRKLIAVTLATLRKIRKPMSCSFSHKEVSILVFILSNQLCVSVVDVAVHCLTQGVSEDPPSTSSAPSLQVSIAPLVGTNISMRISTFEKDISKIETRSCADWLFSRVQFHHVREIGNLFYLPLR